METLRGKLLGEKMRVAVIVAAFNRPITTLLKESALETFLAHGMNKQSIQLIEVPGAFELPLIAKKCATNAKYDAVLALGAVIKGETPHFDYVCAQVSSGLMQVSLATEKPVIFSVLTTNTVEQAWNRAGVKGEGVGVSGARAALEMISLIRQLEE